jgi:hypothetical protein
MPIVIIIFVGAIIPIAALIAVTGNWLAAIGLCALMCGFVLIAFGDMFISRATRYRIFVVCIAFGAACLGVSVLHWPAWALLVPPGLTTTWAMLKSASRPPIPSEQREEFARRMAMRQTILGRRRPARKGAVTITEESADPTPSTHSVLVTHVRDDGDRWAIGEGRPELEDVAWWSVLKSVVPTPPPVGLTCRLTVLNTGSLQPEVVAVEGSDGVGYGLSPDEIRTLIVKDAVEDILSSLSTDVWGAGWRQDMPQRAWELLFELPDPDYFFAYGTHDQVVAQLVKLLDLTVAHGWWPCELDDTDERGSRIGIVPLSEWNDSIPECLRIAAESLPCLRQQLTPTSTHVQ